MHGLADYRDVALIVASAWIVLTGLIDRLHL